MQKFYRVEFYHNIIAVILLTTAHRDIFFKTIVGLELIWSFDVPLASKDRKKSVSENTSLASCEQMSSFQEFFYTNSFISVTVFQRNCSVARQK